MNKQQLKELQKKLNYNFKKPELLIMALTHSSYANENKKDRLASNERLEFLGDSILSLVVAELIYKHKSNIPEGQMTKLRAELVCEKNLAALAQTIDLGSYIILGRGEDKGGGRFRPSILADTMEALLAAIYLDSGLKHVSSFIKKRLFKDTKDTKEIQFEITDYKTTLQELIQTKPGQALSYHVVKESGPDHMKTFTVEVHLNGKHYGIGTGKSKKEAEQAAAMSALNSDKKAGE